VAFTNNIEESVNVEINNRCPEEPLAAEKWPSDVGGGRGLQMSPTGVYLAIGVARFKVGKPRQGDANERRTSEWWKIYKIEKQLTYICVGVLDGTQRRAPNKVAVTAGCWSRRMSQRKRGNRA
jgi:hypothetical protein